MKGLAIWLIPTPNELALLKQHLMEVPPLENPLPPDYQIPRFAPHITLATLAKEKTLEDVKAALLSQKAKLDLIVADGEDGTSAPITGPRLDLKFRALETEEVRARSVVIDIEPSESLMNLRELVFAAFPEDDLEGPRFPHMSLFYIDEEYAQYRKPIRDALWAAYGQNSEQSGSESGKERVEFRFPAGAGAGEKWLKGMTPDKVRIFHCDGPPEVWKELDTINLPELKQ